MFAATDPIGNVCSLPFFVTLAGRVIVHRSEEECCDERSDDDDFERDADAVSKSFVVIHEDCRAAQSPRRIPESIKILTMVAKCVGSLGLRLAARDCSSCVGSRSPKCSQARHIHFSSSSERTRDPVKDSRHSFSFLSTTF